MPLCFAYGSNMDLPTMVARCGASRPLGLARLPRHRFVITAEGYASVMRDARRDVWGLLWDMAFADMPALDRYESVANGLYRKLGQSVLTGNGPKRVLIYVARSAAAGAPRPGYLEGILAAARAAGLPGDYVRELEAWSTGVGPRQAPAPRPLRPLWSRPLASPGPAKKV